MIAQIIKFLGFFSLLKAEHQYGGYCSINVRVCLSESSNPDKIIGELSLSEEIAMYKSVSFSRIIDVGVQHGDLSHPFRSFLCSCGGAADHGLCLPGGLPSKYLPAA